MGRILGEEPCDQNNSIASCQTAVERNLRYLNAFKSDLAEPRLSLQDQMAYYRVPGVSIAMIRHGKLEWAKGYGVSKIHGKPVTVDTIFNAASMSKPLTAMGVLKLVQDKRISLDSNVNLYLKSWKLPENRYTVRKQVTVRELLNHTSGIGTHNGQVINQNQRIPTVYEMLNGEPPATTTPVQVEDEPGKRFAYSNGAYLVLQLLITEVTGKPFAQYMQDAILTPLHMSHSTFAAPLSAEQAAVAATGYAEDGINEIEPQYFVKPNGAAGGLWTTATDYAKFIIELQQAYTGHSQTVLNQASARMMLTGGLGPSSDQHWGLGVRIGGSTARRYFEHGGSGIFQNESVGYFDGDGVVVLTNGGGGAFLANEIVRSVSKVYNWPDFQSAHHTLAKVGSTVQQKLVGTYDFIRITFEDNLLMAEIPIGTQKQVLYPESPVQYFLRDIATTIVFKVNSNGRPNGLEFITPIAHRHCKKS
jgi:CubicO group peptidase (beta-lactamase class C family)